MDIFSLALRSSWPRVALGQDTAPGRERHDATGRAPLFAGPSLPGNQSSFACSADILVGRPLTFGYVQQLRTRGSKGL